MTKETLDVMKQSLKKAKEELSKASYLSECGSNAGIRKMNSNKIEWLRWVVCLAETGLEAEEVFSEVEVEIREGTDEDSKSKCEDCLVSTELQKLVNAKNIVIEDLTNKLNSLQLTYDCELEYRKALANRAKIDYFTEVIKLAHARSWYDEGVLVCPVEYLDRSLLELIKE